MEPDEPVVDKPFSRPELGPESFSIEVKRMELYELRGFFCSGPALIRTLPTSQRGTLWFRGGRIHRIGLMFVFVTPAEFFRGSPPAQVFRRTESECTGQQIFNIFSRSFPQFRRRLIRFPYFIILYLVHFLCPLPLTRWTRCKIPSFLHGDFLRSSSTYTSKYSAL